MNKRGISPLISTVLIICMVIILGVIILTWAGVFSRGLLKQAEQTSEKMAACETGTNVNIRYACMGESTITVMVESLGSKQVKGLIVRVLGSSGGYQEEIEAELNVADLKRFEIARQEVGSVKNIEVLPKVDIKGKIEVCGVKDSETNIAKC